MSTAESAGGVTGRRPNFELDSPNGKQHLRSRVITHLWRGEVIARQTYPDIEAALVRNAEVRLAYGEVLERVSERFVIPSADEIRDEARYTPRDNRAFYEDWRRQAEIRRALGDLFGAAFACARAGYYARHSDIPRLLRTGAARQHLTTARELYSRLGFVRVIGRIDSALQELGANA